MTGITFQATVSEATFDRLLEHMLLPRDFGNVIDQAIDALEARPPYPINEYLLANLIEVISSDTSMEPAEQADLIARIYGRLMEETFDDDPSHMELK